MDKKEPLSESASINLDACFKETQHSEPSVFLKANSLIAQPHFITQYFSNSFEDLNHQQQNAILDELLNIIQTISQNATMLVSKTTQGIHPSFFDVVLKAIVKLSHSRNDNEEINIKLKYLAVLLARQNPLKRSNVQAIYSTLSADFYDGQVDYSRLCSSIELLHRIFAEQKPSRDSPSSYFYFQGKSASLSLTAGTSLPPYWKFESGLSACFWFYLEPLQHDIINDNNNNTIQVPLQKLFTIHTSAENKNGETKSSGGYGGVEAYFVHSQLFYRILPEQYSEPTARSNGISLGTFQPGTWHFIGIDHEGPKSFGRSSSIKVTVNNNETFTSSMEFPRIPSNAPIKRFLFGENLIGKIATVLMFTQPIGSATMQLLPKYYQYGFQNTRALNNLNITIEKVISKAYLLLTPIRSAQDRCFDSISDNDGMLNERSGVFEKDPVRFRMSELGGLQAILPMFYILRFCKRSGETNAVNELLKLFIVLLNERYDLQVQAGRMELLRVTSKLLSELPENYISSKTITLLRELRQVITEPVLLSSYFLDLLWNLDLLKLAESMEVKAQYIGLLRTIYIQNIEHFSKLLKMEQLLWLLVSKCDSKVQQCCEKHIQEGQNQLGLQQKSTLQKLPNSSAEKQNQNNNRSSDSLEETNEIKRVVVPLLEVVEAIFAKCPGDLSAELLQVFNVLSVKCSPCFHLEIFNTLKRILEDKQQDVSKRYLKTLSTNKGIMTLLYLLQNTPFSDVKAMCLKFINIISSANPIPNEYELCNYISTVIFNLHSGKQPAEQVTQLQLKGNTAGKKNLRALRTFSSENIGEESSLPTLDIGRRSAQSFSDNRESSNLINFDASEIGQFRDTSKLQDFIQAKEENQKEGSIVPSMTGLVQPEIAQHIQKWGQTQVPQITNKRQHQSFSFGSSNDENDIIVETKQVKIETDDNNEKQNCEQPILSEKKYEDSSKQQQEQNTPQKLDDSPEYPLSHSNIAPHERVKGPSFKKRLGGLALNIEQVNEKYAHGGGETAIKEAARADTAGETREIAELAHTCVMYMNGELKYSEENIYDNRMSGNSQNQIHGPKTIRGGSNIDLEQKIQKTPEKLNNPKEAETTIEQKTVSQNLFSMEAFNPVDRQDHSVVEIKQQQQTDETDETNEKEMESLYMSIMEWILHRAPDKLDGGLIITDKDSIGSTHVLQLLMAFYQNTTQTLKPLLLQNLLLIVKWNTANATSLLKYTEFYYWLLDILLQQQIRMFSNEKDPVADVIWDASLKIQAILIKNALVYDPEGYKKLKVIFIWIGVKIEQTIQRDAKNTICLASKYLLRSIWSSIISSLIEESLGNRIQPVNATIFWHNMVQFIFTTQEIIISAHDAGQSNLLRNDIKTDSISEIFHNYCVFSDPSDTNTPTNLKEQLKENQWLDVNLVSGLLRVMDGLWEESKLKSDSSSQRGNNFARQASLSVETESEAIVLERDIRNMLQFARQEQLIRDLDILTSSIGNDRGTMIKVYMWMFEILVEDLINRKESEEILKEWLGRLEHFIKYLIIISENARDAKKISIHRETLILTILRCLQYLYKCKKSKDIIGKLAAKTLKRVVTFILLIVDCLQETYGSVDEYTRGGVVNSLSPQIPPHNMIVFELIRYYLIKPNGQTLITSIDIDTNKKEYFLSISDMIFSESWISAFRDANSHISNVITPYFTQEQLTEIVKYIRRSNTETAQISLRSMKMNENNKLDQAHSFSSLVYQHALRILEKQEHRKLEEMQLDDESMRTASNIWKKIWKRLRVHNGVWRHAELKNQVDTAFSVSWQENQPKSRFFDLKIDKFVTRNKMRPFLKLRLIEPSCVEEYNLYWKQLRGVTSSFSNTSKLTLYIQSNQMDVKNNGNNSQTHSVLNQSSSSTSSNVNLSDSQRLIQESSNTLLFDNTTQASSPPHHQNTASPPPSGTSQSSQQNSYLFNLGKSFSKNIAKTFKSILPFSSSTVKEGSKSNEGGQLLLIHQEVHFTKKCQWIKTLTTRNGFLSMTEDHLIFQFESLEQKESHVAMMPHKVPDDRRLLKQWPLKQIQEVQLRRYILRRSALELFMLDGTQILLNFPSQQSDAEEVSRKLIRNKKKRCPNIKDFNTLDNRKLVEKSGILNRWMDKKISNFEYLMHLNCYGSRSNQDLTQYPVFPWILSDYKSQSVYSLRDLSKSMGASGTQERIEIYQERFSSIDPFQDIPPFHFGSHYSSPAIVLQYLIRLQSFTKGAKILQGNKFDIADRLFWSLEDTFRCATEDVADVRELIPELFYMPELLINLNREEFGSRQQGQKVDSVDLPPWCDFDPYKFIVAHRKALESEEISCQLNQWIDLIYGFKQNGKEAEKNLNVFYHMTYENNVDLNSIKDESTRISTETQIINFGQTPQQLFFDKPHLQRPQIDSLNSIMTIADSQAEIKVFRPSQEKKKRPSTKEFIPLNFFIGMPVKAIIVLKWVSKSRFVSLRRNGEFTQFRWYNTPVQQAQQTAVPFQCGEDKTKEVTLGKAKKSVINSMDSSVQYSEYPCYILKESKSMILGGTWDGSIRVISVDLDQLLDTYFVHQETVTAFGVDNKENFLISGSKSGEVVVWKITGEQCKLSVRYVFNDHSARITQIKVSKDLLVFATASEDATINMYNLFTGHIYRSFNHPSSLSIHNIFLSSQPLPCLVFFSSTDRTLYSYSINGQFLAKEVLECCQITCSIVLRDPNFSEILIYGNERGDIQFRELPFLELRKSFNVAVGSPVLSIVVSKEKRFLLCGCSDGQIAVLTDPLISRGTGNIPLLKQNSNNGPK